MVKIGLIQTISYSTNQKGIFRVSEMLKKLGKKETEIVCLPEQWLKKNEILDFDSEFSDFKKIAKEFSMTIIPGAFYEITKRKTSIIAGIEPWQMYVQVRALENRIPILAANVENHRYGGNSLVVDLTENNKVVTTKITKLNGESEITSEFTLDKYEKSRKIRFSDSNKFQ